MVDVPGSTASMQSISIGGSTTNSLEVAGDHDWFRIQLSAGQSISVALNGISLADPFLSVRNSDGTILYQNDDGGPGLDALLAFSAPTTGTYYIDVGAAQNNQTGTYQLSVTPYSLPPLGTIDQMADWMTSGFWDGDLHHFNVTQGGSISVNLTSLTADGRTLARAALQLWSDIIGVTFHEVTGAAQITFDDLDQGTGAFSDGVWSNGITSSATVNVSPSRFGPGTGIARTGLSVYIHEIGHALGLGHNGDYNGGTAFSRYPYEAMFLNDGSAVSIMSYFDNGENTYYASQGFSNVLVATPQIADIAAVQELYGLSTTTRTGNTTYGFHDTSGREVFDASLHPDFAYTIFDSAGVDTLDYSGFGADQLINLNPETFSNVGGLVGNVSIARTVVIENAIGGSGNDALIGNGAANILDGGAGADKMYGGLGNDTYIVDNIGDRAIEASGAGTDTVKSSVSFTMGRHIENLTLTGTNAINGTGNSLDNIIIGNSATNTLKGGTGADKMYGGLGDDTYIVDNVGDRAVESSNAGTDLVKSSVSFTLGSNVEKLTLTGSAAINGTGNSLDNVITGNGAANILDGGAGADHLTGGSGADTFFFDDGDFGGMTADTADEILDFSSIDVLDLHRVDANSLVSGDQAFAFIGTDAFHNVAGELRYEQTGGNTFVYGDINGDGLADFMIKVDGSHTFTSADIGL